MNAILGGQQPAWRLCARAAERLYEALAAPPRSLPSTYLLAGKIGVETAVALGYVLPAPDEKYVSALRSAAEFVRCAARASWRMRAADVRRLSMALAAPPWSFPSSQLVAGRAGVEAAVALGFVFPTPKLRYLDTLRPAAEAFERSAELCVNSTCVSCAIADALREFIEVVKASE